MNNLKFEHKITSAYVIVGGLWILFSDKILYVFVTDSNTVQELQTYKGWFYVLITALLFFAFLKKHLNHLHAIETELKNHKNNLLQLINEKTKDLESLNEKLTTTNNELRNKNDVIYKQNKELTETLENLEEAQSKLIQADKMASLGILTAGVAHEINNPLNYIMGAYAGFEDYFRQYKSMDDSKTTFLLNSIKTGIDRASHIIRGLNDFSRNNKNFDEICDIHAILENCLTMLYNQTKDTISIIKKIFKRWNRY